MNLTSEIQTKIVDQLRRGQRAQGACARAGVTVEEFSDWLRRGRVGDPEYADFARAVQLAFNEGEARFVDKVASSDSVEAATWMLERARPDGYSKQVKSFVDGQIKEFMQRLERGLTPAEFMRVLVVYHGDVASPMLAAPEADADDA